MNLTKLNAIFVTAIVIAAGAFSIGLVFPGLKELEQERNRISEELSQAAGIQRQVGDISSLYQDLMDLREREKALWYEVPPEPRLGQLLNQLSKCVLATGVEKYDIQPDMPRDVDPARLPDQLRLASNLTVQPVVLKFEGKFGQFLQLLEEIKKLERLVRVDTMKILNNESKPGVLSIELVLHAYQRRMA